MKSAEQLQSEFEKHLKGLDYAHDPEKLYAPITYTLSLGGKRLRPLLLLMSYSLFRPDVERAFDVAAGMEIFHNFTLVHDDVMDCAAVRRGHPTVHCKWNSNTAILSGDAMLVTAYRYLCKAPDSCLRQVLETANETFIGITDGQQYDMEFESRESVPLTEYMNMIRLKTSVLLAACCKLGAMIAGAGEQSMEALYGFGEKMGLAFQVQDDLLDVYGDPKLFGKETGGDIMCNKKTYLYIQALAHATPGQLSELRGWEKYDGSDRDLKVGAVRGIYDSIGVRDMAESEIDKLFEEALAELDKVGVDAEKKSQLQGVARSLVKRSI